MASKPSSTPTKIGILSLGDMGAGIARLLIAHGFPVSTNCQGRSEDTAERARNAGVELLSSDLELVQQSSVIFSVVPPRDAEATAQRIIDALSGDGSSRTETLYYVDLNAVAPSTCKSIAALFDKARVPVTFIDACILGGPPSLKTKKKKKSSDKEGGEEEQEEADEWDQPSIPVSGPAELLTASLPDGERLTSVLKLRTISPEIGAASGLKMCFASITKGFTALATQSFTTAHRLGVADELRRELRDMVPAVLARAEKSVPGMPPKAYRWVREMEEIAKTFSDEGGWEGTVFEGIAGVYRAVAEDGVLGKEKIGKRKRGTSLDDVAAVMAEGLEVKRKKRE
ncbi:6-phosphogluconate dehydrogenase C-terminal domain-like protein [Trichoderma citrinoviride]|uniref:6-phosphogluconate dehydrogenase C-terminal domain-like protein n=1 Tax=Trichoderma citrinoviride TaxID=58853 RepID=A0A2T4B7K1_9HYPO|nr:6-phosphogluconate dehydrogenase C-terminal domain-like protein [Trichoderma citrinoviride]PTB65313.1 6-phosphogluconate dehydrogenase C-terminal domain-like protein [Trichoderma citrinoviride]